MRTLIAVTTLSEALTDKQRSMGSPADHVPAAALGVSSQTYNRWRSGTMVPHESAALAIAAWLEMPIEEVYLLLARSRVARDSGLTTTPDRGVTRAEFDTLLAKFEELLRRLDDPSLPPPTGDDPASRSRRRSDAPDQRPHQN